MKSRIFVKGLLTLFAFYCLLGPGFSMDLDGDLFSDLSTVEVGAQAEEEAEEVLEDVTLETGAFFQYSGQIQGDGDALFIEDAETGEKILLEGFRVKEGQDARIYGVLDLQETAEDTYGLVLRGPFSKAASFALANIATENDTEPPKEKAADTIKISVPSNVKEKADIFFKEWAAYVKAAKEKREELIKKKFPSGYDIRKHGYAAIAAVEKQAYRENKDQYSKAIQACDDYIHLCETEGIWEDLDTTNTWLYIDKNDFLMRVLSKDDNQTLLAVPFCCGANPDLANKQRRGDCRTPQVPTGMETLEKTPFFIGRRAGSTVAPGMTVRCMGISSTRKEDAYWVHHGMNICIHGSPSWYSMGQPGSHGCCRVMEKHVPHVYALTAVKTPVVIRGLD